MESKVKEDLELLSKNLYLEDPDLWVEFLDRTNTGKFDELVLFLATKYNYISIVKHAITNNLIDLNSTSKNKNFPSIYKHLLYLSKQSEHKDIYNYFCNLNVPTKETNYIEEVVDTEKINHSKKITKNNIVPCFICPSCSSNIFEYGYVVCENKIFNFSSEQNKLIEVASTLLNSVMCNNCNFVIPDTTPAKLNFLCNISLCTNCFKDLRNVGILYNTSLIYDADFSKFIPEHNGYSCKCCNHLLSKEQEKHFSLGD